MTIDRAPSLDVTYVLRDYPVASERFISREIEGLRDLGAKVRILTLRPAGRGTESAHSEPFPVRRAWRLHDPAALAAAARAVLLEAGAAARMLRLALQATAGEDHGTMRACRLWLLSLQFAHRMRGDPPKIVHAHFASNPATLGLLLADRFGCPFGFSVHASDLYREANNIAAKAAHAQHIFACSNVAVADLRRRLPDLPSRRVQLVHHGIELMASGPTIADREEPPLILAVGRFVPKKGFAILLEACAILRDRSFTFRCAIVGDGPDQDRLSETIGQLELDDHVRLVPWRSGEDLDEIYRGARALAVPSVVAADGDRDNIPNVVLEALAHGVPVVASSLPSMSGVLAPAEAGLLVPPGDAAALAGALRNICADGELAERLAKRGRELAVAEFNAKRNARKIAEHFGRAICAPLQPERS